MISLALAWMMFEVVVVVLISIGEGSGDGKKVNCSERFSVLTSDCVKGDSDICG